MDEWGENVSSFFQAHKQRARFPFYPQPEMAAGAGAAAAAAAAAAASSASPPVEFRDPLPYLTEEELVDQLGGVRHAQVSVNQDLVADVEDSSDREILTRVAATIVAFFVGRADPLDHTKRVTETCIDLKVSFPIETCFDDKQFDAIKHLDEDRIRKIWVQAEPDQSANCIVVSMWRKDAQRDVTVLDVVLVQRTTRRESGETYDGEPDPSIGRNGGKRRRTAAARRT